MTKTVQFDRIKNYPDVTIPYRSTQGSAGYDFEAAETIHLDPQEIKLIPTGIKAKLAPGKVLILANRSSNPLKHRLILINGIGVIDSDYYDNPHNEGHIQFQFFNLSNEPITIEKGSRIGQGLVVDYYLTEDDQTTTIRQGGFGSTGN